ncbi:MAG: exodeoxyribonuclease V subunit alpha [Burkholderiaceae bacterium]
MKMTWHDWAASGLLRPLDTALAEFLREKAPGTSDAVLLAAGLTSFQLGRGHVCLDLSAVVEDPRSALGLSEMLSDPERRKVIAALTGAGSMVDGMSCEAWTDELRAAKGVVAHAEDAAAADAPLVLAGQCVYLQRYWRYEREVEAAIRQRLATTQARLSVLPAQLFRSTLEALFPSPPSAGSLDWQKVACALAARSAFAVITGGPGTGKTTTVVRLLALLQRLALAGPTGRPLRILLAAPTGKAATRLQAALAGALHQLPAVVRDYPSLLASIPSEVSTVHRLLGAYGNRPGQRDRQGFRYGQREKLPVDLLVIDEASMIDLEMMAAVVRALPDAAGLVLLGDKDQLSSVEAGAVLGQLCAQASTGRYLPETVSWLQQNTGQRLPSDVEDARGSALDQQVVMLRTSHRFTKDSGIGRLAAAVHQGDPVALGRVLSHGYDDLFLHRLERPYARAFGQVLFSTEYSQTPVASVGGFLKTLVSNRPAPDAPPPVFAQWAADVLRSRAQFQVLCALRDGPLGVHDMNQMLTSLLAGRALIAPHGQWYEGRPVLMTRNDYGLGLMNGDMGVTLRVPVTQPSGARVEALRVAFFREEAEEPIRWVVPSRLDAVETAFALTVHKSQGSEFDRCLLVMPEAASLAATRELVYTAITRARLGFSLAAPEDPAAVLSAAMQRKTRRNGGLFARVFPSDRSGL